MYVMDCHAHAHAIHFATVRGKRNVASLYISRSNENLKITYANVQVFCFFCHIMLRSILHINKRNDLFIAIIRVDLINQH